MGLPLVEVVGVDYGAHEAAMARYRDQGELRARALGNRGALRFAADGGLDPAIVEAYERCGFYVFEGVLGPDELADLEHDVADLLERAPAAPGAPLDRHGRPALGVERPGDVVTWVAPLSDPVGGTDWAHGRHPVKMIEPVPPPGAPEHVVQLILGPLQFSDACLRLYGHPGLLAIAAAVNGPDFTPFNEAVWIKHPRLGGSVAWHQDGFTHWGRPDLDGGTHGFNFMAQLYGSTAANGLWVVPGSHVGGQADIPAMVAAAGSERLPDAVPLLCGPGDVAMTSRQAVHGSFANTSPDVRVTINLGFHRRRSVLGVETSGVYGRRAVYDDARIRERSLVLLEAIDARAQRFPDEPRFTYGPLAGEEDAHRWTPEARARLAGYNLLDLAI
jgi:hypothetical protein